MGELRPVVYPDATYRVIAEREALGALCVREEDRSGELCSFDYSGDPSTPRSAGLSLREALATGFRSETS